MNEDGPNGSPYGTLAKHNQSETKRDTALPLIFISEAVRDGIKSQPQEEEERNDNDDVNDKASDHASEPADSILGSESEGEETNEVNGLLDDE
jgi:hypothetical protein